MLKFDGYGRYATALVKAMAKSGRYDVRPDLVEKLSWDGEMQRLAGIDHSRLTLCIMPCHELRAIPAQTWNLTMYESTKIPAGWAQHANEKAERLIVPCEWCADVFRDNGVKVPIHVVYGGTDPRECEVFPDFPRGDRPYTFIALGDRGTRKGWDVAWTAFCEAFKPTDNVRMIVKARSKDALPDFDNTMRDAMAQKITFWFDEVDDVRDVFAHADCCVYPARSDGWGMWCREAAACGLPVLATNYSGTAVGCEHWAIPLNDYKEVNSELPSVFNPGKWARVNYEEVAYWMRWCYEHPEDAKRKGLDAARWIRENQTWEHTVDQFTALIERVNAPAPNLMALERPAMLDGAEQLVRSLNGIGAKAHGN